MNINLSKYVPNLLILFFGVAVFVFIFYKSATASFTHDESFTYLHYPHTSFQKIISFSDSYTNNHILNSLFMKYAEMAFGNTEIALRLPNLLLLIVFMVYGFLLLKPLKARIRVPLFVLLISNVLVIDLFGLARGYGLSIGFMIMAIFHFLKMIQQDKSRDIIIFHLAMLLACLANFTMLAVYLALVITYLIVAYLKNLAQVSPQKKKLRSIIRFLVPGILSVIVLYEPARRVITYNKMDFGGGSGFYADTVKHLIINLFQGSTPSPFWLLICKMVVTGIIVLGLVLIIKRYTHRSFTHDYSFLGLTITNLLLIVMAIIFIIQHHLLGTSYPISRFSVFLVPLFLLHLGFLLVNINFGTLHKVVFPLVIILVVISISGFVAKANLNAFGEWSYDRNTKVMLEDLKSEINAKSNDGEKITLGVNWLFEPTVNFYRQTKNLFWLDTVVRDGLTNDNNYYYLLSDDLEKLKPEDYEIIREYQNSASLLIKNTGGK